VQSVLTAEDQTQGLRSMQYLAEMLSAQWAAHFSHCMTATCTTSSGMAAVSSVHSTAGRLGECLSDNMHQLLQAAICHLSKY